MPSLLGSFLRHVEDLREVFEIGFVGEELTVILAVVQVGFAVELFEELEVERLWCRPVSGAVFDDDRFAGVGVQVFEIVGGYVADAVDLADAGAHLAVLCAPEDFRCVDWHFYDALGNKKNLYKRNSTVVSNVYIQFIERFIGLFYICMIL